MYIYVVGERFHVPRHCKVRFKQLVSPHTSTGRFRARPKPIILTRSLGISVEAEVGVAYMSCLVPSHDEVGA